MAHAAASIAGVQMSAEFVAVAASLAFLANFLAIIVAIYKLGNAVGKFELIGKQQASEISTMRDELKEFRTDLTDLKQVIIDLAVQDQRLTNMSARVGRMEQLTDDLRRGEGHILPLNRGAHEVP